MLHAGNGPRAESAAAYHGAHVHGGSHERRHQQGEAAALVQRGVPENVMKLAWQINFFITTSRIPRWDHVFVQFVSYLRRLRHCHPRGRQRQTWPVDLAHVLVPGPGQPGIHRVVMVQGLRRGCRPVWGHGVCKTKYCVKIKNLKQTVQPFTFANHAEDLESSHLLP